MSAEYPYVLWFDQCDTSRVPQVGGKCANLGELLKAGIAVPGGFAVTTAAHDAFLRENNLLTPSVRILQQVDLNDMAAVDQASQEIRARIDSAPLPPAVAAAIRGAYDELVNRLGTDAVPVAVRSSATAEDLYTASFAGQLETYLWVQGDEQVARHAVRCWSALFTPHAVSYRTKMGFGHDGALMSVGVQHMVDARTAGVMFTLNPSNGDRSKVMLESCWGLGEGLVSGGLNPDRFLVDKVTLTIVEATVAVKEVEYRFDAPSGRVAPVPVPQARRNRPSLNDDEVIDLARLAKRIEAHYGRPQDIEWAIGNRARTAADQGTDPFHVLQSRSETVWSQRPAQAVTRLRANPLDYILDDLRGRAAR